MTPEATIVATQWSTFFWYGVLYGIVGMVIGIVDFYNEWYKLYRDKMELHNFVDGKEAAFRDANRFHQTPIILVILCWMTFWPIMIVCISFQHIFYYIDNAIKKYLTGAKGGM